jgi:hypothetical protein
MRRDRQPHSWLRHWFPQWIHLQHFGIMLEITFSRYQNITDVEN